MVRWNQSGDLRELRGDMDRLMGSWLGEVSGADCDRQVWAPPANVKETADGFEIRLDLPGVEKENLKVSVFGENVTVRGERHLEEKEEGESWRRVERFAGKFERRIGLGVALDSSKVKAVYHDGVLEIAVPKAESAKPREIEVEGRG